MSYARKTIYGTTYGNLTDEDRQNAQIGMANAGREDRRQGMDMTAQLALQELQERTRQFDLGRGDRADERAAMTNLARQSWDREDARDDKRFGREDSRFDKQFEYMTGRDTREDAFRREQFQFGKEMGSKQFEREDNRFNLERADREALRKEARNDKFGSAREQMGFELMKSPDPKVRALGATMLGKSPTFEGINLGEIGSGLAPEVTPEDAIKNRPSIGANLNEAAGNINRAWTPESAEVEKAKVDEAIRALAARGVPPEEAQAYVRQQLDQQIEAPSFWSHPISSTIDALLPGTPMTSNFSDRGQKRAAFGLNPQGR